MANTKKTVTSDEVKETKEDTKDNSELEFLRKQMEEQAKKIETLTNALLVAQANTVSVKSDKYSFIGSREINGTPIHSPNNDVKLVIKYGSNNAIKMGEHDIKSALQSNYVREYLEKGILYFVDEEDYKYYDVRHDFDLKDEDVVSIVYKSQNQMISDFNRLTDNKRDDPVVHCLFYRIAELIKDNKLGQLKYENRLAIEKYFNFSLDQAQMILDVMSKIQIR